LPGPAASAEAGKIAQLQGGNGNVASIPQFIRADFAGAIRDVLFGMCVIMAVAGLVALRGLRPGVQQETDEAAASAGAGLPGEGPDADLSRSGPGRSYPLLSSGSMTSSGPVASPVVIGSGAVGSTCLM